MGKTVILEPENEQMAQTLRAAPSRLKRTVVHASTFAHPPAADPQRRQRLPTATLLAIQLYG
ncbi:hypothetical protein CLG94_03690 [Candidatus Methylomirabilis limnetica]|uniref:Uncharacterized protein n=1 Tax=Candidatus Methylomirabilis limnetica TaxID=2033718 RepID=A0A2T4TZD0_9BACT|nr:hypothetical protein [Candidatus Methylomirabilis limnetica]PTL36473.1 hypothetical protein CLG94_03690 [Candidatus Methylomirabilis limnetica]